MAEPVRATNADRWVPRFPRRPITWWRGSGKRTKALGIVGLFVLIVVISAIGPWHRGDSYRAGEAFGFLNGRASHPANLNYSGICKEAANKAKSEGFRVGDMVIAPGDLDEGAFQDGCEAGFKRGADI